MHLSGAQSSSVCAPKAQCKDSRTLWIFTTVCNARDFCRGQDSFLIHSHTVSHAVAYLKSAPKCGIIFSSLTLHTAIHCGLLPHCLVPPCVDMCVMGVLCSVEQVLLLK